MKNPLSLGEDLYASGSLDVSSNSIVFIQENLNMNGLGESNVECNSGTFSVGNTLTLAGTIQSLILMAAMFILKILL